MDLAAAGLSTQPFRTHGTPSILVPYASQRTAERFLGEMRSNDHGLGLFHGPPLSGKTTVIRHFTASLPENCAVAVVDGAGMKAGRLLAEILHQFGYDLDLRSLKERLSMVRVFAQQQAASDEAPLLIVENAHAPKPDALDMLCELADLKVRGKSALRMILVSDRPLLPIVRAAAMQRISNRVTGEFLLRPMTREETAHYLLTKLISGGCRNPGEVIPREVCNELYSASGGWPGVLDRLTLLALSRADRCPVRIDHVPRRPQSADKPSPVKALKPEEPQARQIEKCRAAPILIVTCRGKTLQQVALERARLIIGRADHNDLHVVGEFISRQHAVLVRRNGTTLIMDLKSKNGTFVNGKRISSQILINNDIVSLGDHRIKFIDPAARRRTMPGSPGLDETAIAKSLEDPRRVAAKKTAGKPAKSRKRRGLLRLLRIAGN